MSARSFNHSSTFAPSRVPKPPIQEENLLSVILLTELQSSASMNHEEDHNFNFLLFLFLLFSFDFLKKIKNKK